MNTDPYERRLDREIEPPSPEPSEGAEANALAHHRDPSLSHDGVSAPENLGRPSVAWVRPSELPTAVGSKFIRRGIDLQSELTRRARRGPGAAARSAQRLSRRSIARPEPSTPTVERGVEL